MLNDNSKSYKLHLNIILMHIHINIKVFTIIPSSVKASRCLSTIPTHKSGMGNN